SPKRDIVERLGVSESKVRVVPQGIDRPAPALAERSANGVDPRVLYVGSIFNRRRIPDLIRAVAALSGRRPGVSLDLVGDNRTFPTQDIDVAIDNHAMTATVRWHRYATDAALGALYPGPGGAAS